MDKPVIKLAVLSTDHEDMEGYEASLRTLFEQTVSEIPHFTWGIENPKPTVRQSHHNGFGNDFEPGEKGATSMHLMFPKRLEREVSLFQELFTNTYMNRDYQDSERRKTFTLALFEVVPAGKNSFTLGRIKLLTNVGFTQIGVGFGKYGGQESPYPRTRYHDVPEDWKATPGQPIIGRNDSDEEGESSFTIVGRELIANKKARDRVADIAQAYVVSISAAEPKAKAPAKK